ncbi:hypothetical protein HO133_008549 [Letharia lupina]|uniref:Uncharacterized protein n=1 Tax=Letharia lupina TaxID=560253 RepID=A0A8H6CPC3_9LECA|nr:uncharacterized protein HO133_008549 [Letharia lupina]KAF6227108.1 hypothetical protein HO133_008549 [Letharia lupina]
MFFCLILWALYSDTVLAASLSRRSESVGSLAAGPIPSSDLLSPANILVPSSNNSSSDNRLKIACDATRYGKNLKVSSCRNVFNFMKKDETTYTFAERDSGVPNDGPLPLRTLSNDGLCFVQPVLSAGAISGKASPTEIGQAALVTLQTCVIERGMGGMAFNIGGDNKVNVAIADYKPPNVKCDTTSTPGPAWNSCVAIVVNMRATKQARVFGYSGDPSVEEELPLVLEGSSIDIEGPATVMTWYELWEAVNAITSRRGNIRLELSGKKYDPGEKVGNASRVSLADAGVALQYFDTVSSQAGSTGFNRAIPFELLNLTGVMPDNGSSVTLPGDPWTNGSVMASA